MSPPDHAATNGNKTPKLVGNFIRQRREALGLSQRALGLMFSPPVTTQFISNIERGVTPLPPAHVPTLVKALMVSEEELMGLLEREYTAKLSGRLGRSDRFPGEGANTDATTPQLIVSTMDYDFMRSLYDAYRQADSKTRQAFATVVETILAVPKERDGQGQSSGSEPRN
jgi:transcriptional regulator with XRE-family HTH domain